MESWPACMRALFVKSVPAKVTVSPKVLPRLSALTVIGRWPTVRGSEARRVGKEGGEPEPQTAEVGTMLCGPTAALAGARGEAMVALEIAAAPARAPA